MQESLDAAISQPYPITPWIINSNDTFLSTTPITININAQTYSHKCAIERNTDLSRPPGTQNVCVKNTPNTHTSPLLCRADLI